MALEFPEFRNTYIPDQLSYTRMSNYNDEYADIQYEEFINWNRRCFNELLNPDFAWLKVLCKRITDKKISIVDMETAIELQASYIYFDKKKNICIACPR